MRVLETYDNALRKLRPEQKNVFEKYRNANPKVSQTFLLDRLRFPASDARKLNEYVKLVADETKKKNLDFPNLYTSVVTLQSRMRSLPRVTEKKSSEKEQEPALTPEQKIEQEVFSLGLSAMADKETLRTLHNVLRLPFTGSNRDQTYLAKAKQTALELLSELVAVKRNPKLQKTLEFNAKKLAQQLSAKGIQNY